MPQPSPRSFKQQDPEDSNQPHGPKRKRKVTSQAGRACDRCGQVKLKCVMLPGLNACERCTTIKAPCVWKPSKRGKWSRKTKTMYTASVDEHELGVVSGEENDLDDGSESTLGYREGSSTNLPHFETPAEEPQDFGGAIHFKVDNSLFPLGLLAESSLLMEHAINSGPTTNNGDQASPVPRTGPANPSYFQQGLNKHFLSRGRSKGLPLVIQNQTLTEAEAERLFHIYFRHCNHHICLLDRTLCSPKACADRSPFLYTAICAVAARYYRGGALQPPLMRQAKTAGIQAMLDAKTTYTVQGFLILAYWGPPATAYELDTSWLFAGLAIRLGHEIGIHHKNFVHYPDGVSPALKARYQAETMNRERTWFSCFIIDRLSGALSGKPETVKEKFLLKSGLTWCDQPGATTSDVYLSAICELLRIVFRILDVIYSSAVTKSAIAPNIDYIVVGEDLTTRLDDWIALWDRRVAQSDALKPSEDTPIYRAQLRLHRAFYRLLPLSIGLQNNSSKLSGNSATGIDVDAVMFCYPCYQCAMELAEIVLQELRGDKWLKYAPDHWIIIVAYSACFLLKLNKSRYGRLFNAQKILDTAEAVAQALEEAAEDEEHSPYVYAAFIRKRLAHEKSSTPNVENPFDQSGLADSPSVQNLFSGLPISTPSHPIAPPEQLTDLDNLLQTDWLDSVLSQQTQGVSLDMLNGNWSQPSAQIDGNNTNPIPLEWFGLGAVTNNTDNSGF